MNEAALLSGRRHKTSLGAEELEEAIDRTLSGPERTSQVISARDKRMIAYHEAGHAVVSWALAQGHDVHRISVVARGQSHGYTLSVAREDRVLLTRSELTAQLAVLLAGRAAEELVFEDPTTGAEEDLNRATALAEKMVRDYGMSDAVGLRTAESRWAGDDAADDGGTRGASSRADHEVGRLLDQAHARARRLVSVHRTHLDRLADRLVAAETLERAEIDRLLAGVPREGASVDPAAAAVVARTARRARETAPARAHQ